MSGLNVGCVIVIAVTFLIWAFLWQWIILPAIIIAAAICVGILLRKILRDLVFGPRK